MTADRPSPLAAPPRAVVRIVMAIRRSLLWLSDRIVPPQVALMEAWTGYYLLHAANVAVRLGLPDLVAEGPKSVMELAQATGTNMDRLARLLRALASYGIMRVHRDGRYASNRLSEVLRDGTTGSLRGLALLIGSPYYGRAWDHLEGALRTGENPFFAAHGVPLFDYLRANEADAERFAGAMTSLTEFDAPALAAAYDFSLLRQGATICDVAGGHGALLAEILERHAKLRGVLFDKASVVNTAGARLTRRGVGDRVECRAGDFFASVPGGCDVYLLKDILHDWDDDTAVAILKNVRRAMPPGARVLIAEMVVDDVEERYFGALFDLIMMATTHDGRQRSEGALRHLFERAGYGSRESCRLRRSRASLRVLLRSESRRPPNSLVVRRRARRPRARCGRGLVTTTSTSISGWATDATRLP